MDHRWFWVLLLIYPNCILGDTLGQIKQGSLLQECDVNNGELTTIFNSIDTVIKNNREGHVATNYLFTRNRIKQGSIQLLLSDDPGMKTIGTCAEFYAPHTNGYDENIPAIRVDNFLLTLYKTHPSLAMAILIHETQHECDFVNNHDAFMLYYTGNPVEGYFYEMDASYLEALFLSENIDTNNTSVTKFEKYLVRSLSRDGLRSYSIVFRQTDNFLAQKMYDLSRNDENYKTAINKFLYIGDSLKGAFLYPTTKTLWEKYISLMPIYTYCQYGPQMASDIISRKKIKNRTDVKINLERYPTIINKIKEVSKIIAPYKTDISDMQKQIKENFPWIR